MSELSDTLADTSLIVSELRKEAELTDDQKLKLLLMGLGGTGGGIAGYLAGGKRRRSSALAGALAGAGAVHYAPKAYNALAPHVRELLGLDVAEEGRFSPDWLPPTPYGSDAAGEGVSDADPVVPGLSQRLSEIPEDQRGDVLQSLRMQADAPEAGSAMSDELVRMLPGGEAPGIAGRGARTASVLAAYKQLMDRGIEPAMAKRMLSQTLKGQGRHAPEVWDRLAELYGAGGSPKAEGQSPVGKSISRLFKEPSRDVSLGGIPKDTAKLYPGVRNLAQRPGGATLQDVSEYLAGKPRRSLAGMLGQSAGPGAPSLAPIPANILGKRHIQAVQDVARRTAGHKALGRALPAGYVAAELMPVLKPFITGERDYSDFLNAVGAQGSQER